MGIQIAKIAFVFGLATISSLVGLAFHEIVEKYRKKGNQEKERVLLESGRKLSTKLNMLVNKFQPSITTLINLGGLSVIVCITISMTISYLLGDIFCGKYLNAFIVAAIFMFMLYRYFYSNKEVVIQN